VNLGGRWLAAEADEALRRAYPDPDFDDAGWGEVEVPGFGPGGAPSVLYRRAFVGGGGGDGERSWLVFDGISYQSDVWLDGSYVGDTEGSFFPHEFEVTSALSDRSEHVLAVEVAGAGGQAGIWRDVRIESTGPVRIHRLRALCGEATPERAVVSFRALLDAVSAGVACLRTTVGGVEHEQEQPVAAGENRVMWNVVVERPELWWPWSLGAQPLCDVEVSVRLVDGPVSHRRRLRMGLRQVRMKNWVCTVNGERIFLKGAVGEDVAAARAAGLDLVRVEGHPCGSTLYDAADEAGMLLWQNSPGRSGPEGMGRKQAARQAREAVDLLGHHPSVLLWCGRSAAGRRSFERSDTSRPTVPGPSMEWHDGSAASLARALARWPRSARFVAGLGDSAAIEVVRRLKYRPTGGFCAAVSSSLAAACAPVIVVADPLPAAVAGGDALALDVHVVSDLRVPVEGATVTAVLSWSGGSHTWRWTGKIGADTCERVGTISFVVPEAVTSLALDLDLTT
jgi:hypothetical protein